MENSGIIRQKSAFAEQRCFAGDAGMQGIGVRWWRRFLIGKKVMRRSIVFALLSALIACSPKNFVDKVGRRTAETVVQPVVGSGAATQCVVQNADAAEIQALVRDVGTVAGSSTEALIARIVSRLPTQDCFRAAGIPAPVL